MTNRFSLLVSAALLLATIVCPASADAPPQARSDVIRIWGDDAFKSALEGLEKAFRVHHPGVSFENKLFGTDTGLAALYTGVADLAIFGRNIYPVETMAFAWVHRHNPTGFEIATGSLASPRKTPPVAVLVHRLNPTTSITLVQLDSIIDEERRAGAAKQAKTWGDLGATGDFATHPIHVYARQVGSGTSAFIRQIVMKGSNKWNWDTLSEFVDRSGYDADEQINQTLALDPDGLALTTLGFPSPDTKPLAVAQQAGEPAVKPTAATVAERSYPLSRGVYVFIDGQCHKPISPLVREFLAFVLSGAGQAALPPLAGFMPLPDDLRQTQEAKLRALTAVR